MNTMRDIINLLNVAHDESKQFQASVVKTFRTKLAETRNVKRSAVATAKQHGIDVKDVAFIVREAKEKAMESDDAESGMTATNEDSINPMGDEGGSGGEERNDTSQNYNASPNMSIDRDVDNFYMPIPNPAPTGAGHPV